MSDLIAGKLVHDDCKPAPQYGSLWAAVHSLAPAMVFEFKGLHSPAICRSSDTINFSWDRPVKRSGYLKSLADAASDF